MTIQHQTLRATICIVICLCTNTFAQENQDSASEEAGAVASNDLVIDRGGNSWAFELPTIRPIPRCDDDSWPAGDIDRFVLEKLKQQGLKPARDAERGPLLRRVTFNLTGLPPTLSEIGSFAADDSPDDSPDAIGKVVERLLASPHFGERWGRHWLDLTGYADTMGTGRSVPARHAWRYRDYIVKSFNADKSYDRFITEQLAGDLLPYDNAESSAEQITATGFLAIGPWELVNGDKVQLRMDVVDMQIDRVGRTLLGLTLGCSRCHDHKFDPVPQTDYYALAGIFMSTTTVRGRLANVFSGINHTELRETPAQLRRRAVAIERFEDELVDFKRQQSHASEERDELDGRIKELKEKVASDGKNQQGPSGDREESAISRDEPSAMIVSLEKQREATTNRISQLSERIKLLEFNRPRPAIAMAVEDNPEPEDCRINQRGNARQLGDIVQRGFLSTASKSKPRITAGASGRLELAAWIASDDNPLTARVFVNRVWHHLFGTGLVRSVDNFGVGGERPTHPELLDYLAIRFIEQGWSTKKLIRQIVLSRAYRMSSDHNQVAFEIDPDNRWLWRMNRRRLDVESIRDAILAASGKLDQSPGGPSLPLEIPGNVQFGAPDSINETAKMSDRVQFRRTVYQPVKRKQPFDALDILSVFDFPDPGEETGARSLATVPTQALYLMNSPFIQEQARATARRLLGERDDDARRVELLYMLALGRPATDTEVQRGVAFVNDFRRGLGSQNKSADLLEIDAWAPFCQSVLVSNEFLFRQ